MTGSRDDDEDLATTAPRELSEEMGIDADAFGGPVAWNMAQDYEIYPQWRHRYPPGTTHNTEHVYSLDVRAPVPVKLAPREHLRHEWLGGRRGSGPPVKTRVRGRSGTRNVAIGTRATASVRVGGRCETGVGTPRARGIPAPLTGHGYQAMR